MAKNVKNGRVRVGDLGGGGLYWRWEVNKNWLTFQSINPLINKVLQKIAAYEACHAEMHTKIFVFVIPKEGGRAPSTHHFGLTTNKKIFVYNLV